MAWRSARTFFVVEVHVCQELQERAISTPAHSRTQSPSYARCDEGLWPNPKPETIKTW
jgi:hypothetical protein